MIGCDKFQVEGFFDHDYPLQCLYEAQNPRNLSILDKLEYSITLSNPLEMYVFGYTLVHAPIEWELTVSTSFDMLARSLADNGNSDRKILGSFKKINVYIKKHCIPLKLDDLPRCLRDSIVEIVCGVGNAQIPTLIEGVTSLHNLKKVYFDFNEACKDDNLLYQCLPSSSNVMTELELHFYHMTAKGMQELSIAISRSQSLECITMKYYKKSTDLTFQYCTFNKLIEAALSCSTVKSLTLDNVLPFQMLNSKVISHVTQLEFILQPAIITSAQRLFDCLCCIADMCKAHSMKILNILIHFPISQLPHVAVNVPSRKFCDFIAILNNSLHCNQTIDQLGSAFRIYCPIHCTILSHALKDPAVLLLDLERSKSLCDLSTLDIVEDYDYTPRWRVTKRDKMLKRPLKRRHSCPNLLEMQPLHNIHPLLYEFLLDTGYNDFYLKDSRTNRVRKRLYRKGYEDLHFWYYREGYNTFIF